MGVQNCYSEAAEPPNVSELFNFKLIKYNLKSRRRPVINVGLDESLVIMSMVCALGRILGRIY